MMDDNKVYDILVEIKTDVATVKTQLQNVSA